VVRSVSVEMGRYIIDLVYTYNNQPYCYDDGERDDSTIFESKQSER